MSRVSGQCRSVLRDLHHTRGHLAYGPLSSQSPSMDAGSQSRPGAMAASTTRGARSRLGTAHLPPSGCHRRPRIGCHRRPRIERTTARLAPAGRKRSAAEPVRSTSCIHGSETSSSQARQRYGLRPWAPNDHKPDRNPARLAPMGPKRPAAERVGSTSGAHGSRRRPAFGVQERRLAPTGPKRPAVTHNADACGARGSETISAAKPAGGAGPASVASRPPS